MADYISKYTGAEIDLKLDQVGNHGLALSGFEQEISDLRSELKNDITSLEEHANSNTTQLADHETRLTNVTNSSKAIGDVATANQESIKALQEVDETNALHFTALDQSVAALETSVSSKLNRFRKWMEGSISIDIGSATLIEISGVSTVGIAHRHYLKLVRIGTETAVLEENKGVGTGVSYTYSIENNILTVTNTGLYAHNITVIY